MNKKISDLTTAGSLDPTDKLEISTAGLQSMNITAQMIADYIDTLMTLHHVLSNGNVMNFSDLIKNNDMSGTLVLGAHYAQLYHIELAKLGSDAIARIEGADSSVEANNANVNITCSGTTTIASPTLDLSNVSVNPSYMTLLLIGGTTGLNHHVTSWAFVKAANDAAAAASGLVVGDIYFNTSTNFFHTKMS